MPIKPLLHDPEALRKARINRRLTLRQAAAKTGISATYLSQMERGLRSCNFKPWRLLDLADLYGVPVEALEAEPAAVAGEVTP
jgi:transcriptional regulator with XRE-family HTH domain